MRLRFDLISVDLACIRITEILVLGRDIVVRRGVRQNLLMYTCAYFGCPRAFDLELDHSDTSSSPPTTPLSAPASLFDNEKDDGVLAVLCELKNTEWPLPPLPKPTMSAQLESPNMCTQHNGKLPPPRKGSLIFAEQKKPVRSSEKISSLQSGLPQGLRRLANAANVQSPGAVPSVSFKPFPLPNSVNRLRGFRSSSSLRRHALSFPYDSLHSYSGSPPATAVPKGKLPSSGFASKLPRLDYIDNHIFRWR